MNRMFFFVPQYVVVQNTIYSGDKTLKYNLKSKSIQKIGMYYMQLYYIFTKTKQYLVF